jgi:hypothetical protein
VKVIHLEVFMHDDEKDKGKGSSGSGKSPTKFMERPGSKPKKEESSQDHSEFINDDLDALENQEKGGDEAYEGWNPPKPPQSEDKKEQDKRKPQKFPETDKRDSSSDDAGDCACP